MSASVVSSSEIAGPLDGDGRLSAPAPGLDTHINDRGKI
jgi:hypothetical protein